MRRAPWAAWPLLALAGLSLVPGASAAPVAVAVDVHVISFGNHDANKGTYVFDFYLHLSYDAGQAPAGFEASGFEFMNGRAGSKELISDEVDEEGVRHLWYRIQANLYSDPRFDDYPYDQQRLKLEMEDAALTSAHLVYVDQVSGSGVNDRLRVAGWQLDGTSHGVEEVAYPFGETYSRFTFTVAVSREPMAATLRSFLPPLAFCVVAAAGMFMHSSKLAVRISVAGSMLISAVGFHISQTVSLPSLGRLTLFDAAMLATYAFLASCLAVAIWIAHAEDVAKKPELTGRRNQRGMAGALLVGLAVFAVLRLL